VSVSFKTMVTMKRERRKTRGGGVVFGPVLYPCMRVVSAFYHYRVMEGGNILRSQATISRTLNNGHGEPIYL